MSPDVQEIVAELAGTVCRCGAPKIAKRSLCGNCYGLLSEPLKRGLHRRLHEGYLDAYRAAVAYLTEATAAERGRIA